MYRICTQNIWKVCNLGPNHSKSVEFLRKTIERICNCTPITRNACVSHFVPKHLKSMSFCLKIFEIYLILDQNLQNLLNFYTTQFEKFRICTQKLQKVFVLENLRKVSDSDQKHWNSIVCVLKTFKKYFIWVQNIRYTSNFFTRNLQKSSDIGLIRKVLNFV